MSTLQIARWIMILGIILFLVGGGIYLLARGGINLFRLPGDFRLQIGNVTCLIPIATSILLSLVMTLILNAIFRLLNR